MNIAETQNISKKTSYSEIVFWYCRTGKFNFDMNRYQSFGFDFSFEKSINRGIPNSKEHSEKGKVYKKTYTSTEAVVFVIWDSVLRSLALRDPCFRMKITLGVVHNC